MVNEGRTFDGDLRIENGRIAVDFNQNLGALLPQGMPGN